MLGKQALHLCVWLVAYDHFQLYHVDPDFLFALRTKQREFYQNRIVIHFGSSFATTDWAANPPRTVYLIIHHAAPFSLQSWPCDKRLAPDTLEIIQPICSIDSQKNSTNINCKIIFEKSSSKCPKHGCRFVSPFRFGKTA